MLRVWKIDILKFLGYFSLFSIIFFSYNKAYSPYIETTYDSASINNREQKGIELFGGSVSESETTPLSVTPLTNSSNVPGSTLIIAFRPENITIDESLLEKIKANVESIYFEPKVTPLSLVIDKGRKEPRGQVAGNKLILSGNITTEWENLKVLVHELGHVIDIYYLKQQADGSDVSNDFYNISWVEYNIKKKDAKIGDFVSGYALSNKYEDFAESFAFYVFHNDIFKARAVSNTVLRQKYDFFKNSVFADDSFISTDFSDGKLRPYNWDTTKIRINEKKYLYYIQ